MTDNRILAVGSVALDTVRTPFGYEKDALGGSATFFSAAARFFSPVSVIAVVGEDFPKAYRDLMTKLGVDISGLETAQGKTFRWEGFYDYDLNKANTLKTELNVFQSFSPKLSESHKRTPHVFLANIDPELQLAVLKQIQKPKLIACDTMNFWIQNKKQALLKLLGNVDIFLCNDSEARELTGEYNLIKAAQFVQKRGVKIFVVKKGEHGVICFSNKSHFLAPAFLLENIYDPTGAGDSFAGGFIGSLAKARKWDEATIRRAVIYGSAVASYNVESFSLKRLTSLKFSEIEKRFQAFKQLTKF